MRQERHPHCPLYAVFRKTGRYLFRLFVLFYAGRLDTQQLLWVFFIPLHILQEIKPFQKERHLPGIQVLTANGLNLHSRMVKSTGFDVTLSLG